MKYDRDNVFYKVIKKEIPSKVVYEDDEVLAINDIAPKAPIHILVLPKKEFVSFDDFVKNSPTEEVASFFKKAQEIAEKNVAGDYRIVGNCGEKSGQEVFHFHLHILGGW
ncbi:MAG: histidine triad nucleotide-binding protein [Rickettsiales bacterium]|jgi:diadenosine tetraphosphate (Ap4A) HIT family hydrolase|nr:histidine triad nucleotide-binding protein [Rickettsiales bacterium]